ALEGLLFDVVNQLNQGAGRVEEMDDRRRIAELNLRAGRKAKAASAVKSAAAYFVSGLSQLPPDSWGADYALAYGLYLELAECECLGGRFEEAERLCGLLAEHARTNTDRVAAAIVEIQLATAQLNNTRAVDVGLECLRRFGIELSRDVSKDDLRKEI